MKKPLSVFCLVLSLVAVFCLPLMAAPVGGSNLEREHLIHATDLSRWQIGLFGETTERDVRSNGLKMETEYTKVEGYVGYEVLDWMVLYIGAGNFQNQLNGLDFSSDPIWSFGARMHLLDHDIESPTLFEDAISVSSTLQYSRSEFKQGGENREWEEIFASITLSVVNDVQGNKLFWPDAIALFVGPVVSDIHSGALHEDQAAGYMCGLEFFFSRKASFHIGILNFDEANYMGGLHVNL